jgi:predicted unusual protein kinase regulating ubiquinone biosynthesis (AarF/ABC1/UbiB family)
MARDEPITSAVHRFVKLSGLMGRVGASVAGSRLLDLTRSDVSKQLHRTENLVRNATRIVQTLGEMKGAAMKVGQMLSLHEGMLPAEVAEVLRALQKEAPKVPAEVMGYEVRGALKNFDDLFESLETEAFAAASIGQVHRGRLRDGREVAVKIQYPLIEEIVKADLKSLRVLLQSLFSLFSDADFRPVWNEVRDRLFEELDYTHEADNVDRMIALHANVPEIVIPPVVREATVRNVLTMELVPGIPPEEACSDRYDPELKNRWGRVLFEFLLRGMLEHRFLHADPNLANFAFLPDGRVIVYDLGCVKRIPDTIADGYARLMRAGAEGRKQDIPGILLDIGVYRENERGKVALPLDLIDPYFDLFAKILHEDPPYVFGDSEELYRDVMALGLSNWSEAADIQFPEHIVFIDRALAGHFGNLNRLRAAGPWRELVLRYTASVSNSGLRNG